MKKLTLLALAIMPSLISSLNPSQALADFNLICTGASVTLTLINPQTFQTLTPDPSGCTFSTTSGANVSILVNTPVLSSFSGSGSPMTNNTATLTYDNNGSPRIVNSGLTASPDSFPSNSTIPMSLSMTSIESNSNEFFAGTYTYEVTVTITSQ